eukprot:5573918-Amphidinium_carterae.1
MGVLANKRQLQAAVFTGGLKTGTYPTSGVSLGSAGAIDTVTLLQNSVTKRTHSLFAPFDGAHTSPGPRATKLDSCVRISKESTTVQEKGCCSYLACSHACHLHSHLLVYQALNNSIR